MTVTTLSVLGEVVGPVSVGTALNSPFYSMMAVWPQVGGSVRSGPLERPPQPRDPRGSLVCR